MTAAAGSGGRTLAKQAVRAATAAVGRATVGLRMTPDFLIVGAQRCGTTSLFRDLAAHPAVVPPLFQKGIHFFDMHYGRGLPWYLGHFPVRSVAARRAAATGSRPITGEASPYYVFHPLAPERIAKDLPHVKLIVLLRDPVERAFSAHRQETARGFETEPFERALDLEPLRLAGEAQRMRSDPSYVSFSHQHHAYLARGHYAEQLVALLDLVGSERVLVLDSAAFFGTPEVVWERVLAFLGLPPWRPAAFEQHNARPSSPLPDRLRTRLDDYFRPHDEQLAALLGEVPSWRR
ncbi:MAG: sulfotransferase family protein [Frankiaceae bacterium]